MAGVLDAQPDELCPPLTPTQSPVTPSSKRHRPFVAAVFSPNSNMPRPVLPADLLASPERSRTSDFALCLSPIAPITPMDTRLFSPLRTPNQNRIRLAMSPSPAKVPPYSSKPSNSFSFASLPTSQRPQETPPEESAKLCNCKKSRCLKMYCVCFSRQAFCHGCNCVDCENIVENEEKVLKARSKCAAEQKPQKLAQRKGCHCKKGCNKKYCECFSAGSLCSETCKCVGCLNIDSHQHDNKEPSEGLFGQSLSYSLMTHPRCSMGHDSHGLDLIGSASFGNLGPGGSFANEVNMARPASCHSHDTDGSANSPHEDHHVFHNSIVRPRAKKQKLSHSSQDIVNSSLSPGLGFEDTPTRHSAVSRLDFDVPKLDSDTTKLLLSPSDPPKFLRRIEPSPVNVCHNYGVISVATSYQVRSMTAPPVYRLQFQPVLTSRISNFAMSLEHRD